MHVQMHLHTFHNPDVICSVINKSNVTQTKLVYGLSDDINHIKITENSLK